jgi:hypothetical protein
MPHHIKQDEPTAITADVPNQSGELGLGQVMTEMHRKRHVGVRERVVDGIGLHHRNAHVRRSPRSQVDSDYFNTKLAMDLLSNETVGAPYIDNSTNRQCISTD